MIGHGDLSALEVIRKSKTKLYGMMREVLDDFDPAIDYGPMARRSRRADFSVA